MTITLLPASTLHLPGQTDKLLTLTCMHVKIFFRAPSEQISTKFQASFEAKHRKWYICTDTRGKLTFNTDSCGLEDPQRANHCHTTA